MFSGFLTVNYTTGSHLFFLLQIAENNPQNAPLVLWLQGGPGWPSTYGAFKEVGSFYVLQQDGEPPRLMLNPERWSQDAHILFIDSPVGTGFSYTEKEGGYPTDDDMVAVHLVEALIQVLIRHNKLGWECHTQDIGFKIMGGNRLIQNSFLCLILEYQVG